MKLRGDMHAIVQLPCTRRSCSNSGVNISFERFGPTSHRDGQLLFSSQSGASPPAHSSSARSCSSRASAPAAVKQAGLLGGSSALRGEWEVRQASPQELWQVSELHCRSFHPTALWLSAVLLRFDRLSSFQAAENQERAGWGQFCCLVAVRKLPAPDGPFLGLARHPGIIRIPAFLRVFVPPSYKAGFDKTLEDSGIIGTVCVDSTAQFIPMKKRNGSLYKREGMAYLSNLAVDHNFRRLGVGRRLLDEAAAVAKAWGCKSIALQCDPRNKGARDMYAHGGYRHVAHESPWLQYWEGRIGTRLEFMCKSLYK